MHKVKTTKTLYDGLNEQPNLLGKINPKCVLSYIYPARGLKKIQIGLFLTQCFLEYAEFQFIFVLREKQMEESGILFWAYFTKKQSLVFIVSVHK